MIDLGQEQGGRKGDKFSIIRQGASIRHPVAGAMLPGPVVELGVEEVSSVDPAISQVKLRLKQAVQVGDRIRMKEREKSFWDMGARGPADERTTMAAFARLNREQARPGEWVQQDDGRWVRK